MLWLASLCRPGSSHAAEFVTKAVLKKRKRAAAADNDEEEGGPSSDGDEANIDLNAERNFAAEVRWPLGPSLEAWHQNPKP